MVYYTIKNIEPASFPVVKHISYLFTLRNLEVINLGIRRVFRHLRNYLGPFTAILIGTMGMVVVMSTSGDIKKEFAQRLDLIGGATIFSISLEQRAAAEPWGAKYEFIPPLVAYSFRIQPGVAAASLVAVKTKPVTAGSAERQGDFTLLAVDGDFWKLHDYGASVGEAFDKQAVDDGMRVCVIGIEVARALFGREDVVGEYLIIENDLYLVKGVLRGFRAGEGTRFLFVPLTTALSRISNVMLPVRLLVRMRRWEEVRPMAARAPAIAGQYLPMDRVQVEMQSNLRILLRVAFRVEVFANVCMLITLLLGGVGIWNLMMTSVRARTKEIALKKAVGAEDLDILMQFLAEALTICVGAALPGIVLGAMVMLLISSVLAAQVPWALFVQSLGWCLGFTFSIGIGAGLYPAIQASRKEVAVALRHE